MKQNSKIPKREQYGYDRVMLGYYPSKDTDDFKVAEYEDNND